MRIVMCEAMGDAHSRRPDAVRLLADTKGKWEPERVRAKRMVKQWQKEVSGYEVPQA